jgi:ubiquinone/menaquinone biosynthesis C-methylase UbiE
MQALSVGFNLEIKPVLWVRELLMRMFGRPTGVLGRLGGVIMARMNREAAAQIIEMLDFRPDDKVLEVGFGPGVGVELLLHRVPAGSVAGIDYSQEMVKQASARNAAALRNRRVDLRYGSAERLPFADKTFDKVLAINSMQAWPDAGAGLREIQRVLKHGGNVALGFTINSGQPKEGVVESLTIAGFAQARIVDRSKLFLRDRDKAVTCACPGTRSPRSSSVATGPGFLLSPLVRVAERGFPQANWITLTKSCRCNNSSGDDVARHFRPAGVAKLFAGSFKSFTHLRNCLGSERPQPSRRNCASHPRRQFGEAALAGEHVLELRKFSVAAVVANVGDGGGRLRQSGSRPQHGRPPCWRIRKATLVRPPSSAYCADR